MRNFKGVEMRRRFENFARSADGLFCLRELLSADICCGVVLFVELIEFYILFHEMNFVPEKSNAIVGVVTTGFECLPPSCDGLTGPDDHGPMISRLIDRGVSGNQAGPSGSSVGRSPHP
ncbi:ABC transporter G family member 22 [Dorcoceras hygrometricum]|uniref:ABC transporter G family member 22 n=1 Tax=Dorcoceras hygrometricum TaxID=472368 RepID=A0A2Z7BW84_9LAMI|nr:ABC transporter G family member 22 [Dorcoceras hygrometricum]KZV38654.1 ABC transporter G family member 22 [Dorcoceras hygrometricum]